MDEVALPIRVAPPHFEAEPQTPWLSVATRYVAVDKRAFKVRVMLASDDVTSDLLVEANDVLASLSLREWRTDVCPPKRPAPWTACPEADWVRLIAETAGYRITDETGSALVAESHGDASTSSSMSERHFVATARRQ